jgi:PhoH-like ATPase
MSDDKDRNKERKTFVLDTNVLVHDPRCIFNFDEHDVAIPIWCIEEFDRFKNEQTERGEGAREASRTIETMREKARESGTSLNKGVPIGEDDKKGTLYVTTEVPQSTLNIPLTGERAVDNLCLEITKSLLAQGKKAVLVTKDINLRIRADGHNIPCENYLYDKKGYTLDTLFKRGGIREVNPPQDTIDRLFREKQATLDPQQCQEFLLNQALVIKNISSALARYIGNGTVRLVDPKIRAGKIRPKNHEQSFALDALLDPKIRVVALVGKQGTGKTLLALAAGVHLAVNDNHYRRLVVIRSTVVVGKEIGFLPGTKDEKQSTYMGPIFDNLEVIYSPDDQDRRDEEMYRKAIEMGQIELDTPLFMRGRSMQGVYMVVDDAQNMTPHEVRTLMTRVADGGKVVFVGDPYQIDSPYLDEESNGLTTLARRTMGKKQTVVVDFLTKSERDPVIADIADLL